MIYILQPIGGGAIKIGSSVSAETRKASIQSLFPYGVEVLAEFEGARIGEAFLHRCFAPVRTVGEWFSPCPATWRFILDVIDNGRPDFLPVEQRSETGNVIRLAIEMFGSEREAIRSLGYVETSSNVFYGRSGQARLLFAKALRDGILPSYINALHLQPVEVAS